MSSFDARSAQRPPWDPVLTDIADYVCSYPIDSALAFETAHYCLIDTLACGFQALDYPACTKLLGPVVPGAVLPGGARVPGTSYELDPVQAAFNIGAHDPLARFQRHLARGGVGAPVRQPRRHPRRRRLPVAPRRAHRASRRSGCATC